MYHIINFPLKHVHLLNPNNNADHAFEGWHAAPTYTQTPEKAQMKSAVPEQRRAHNALARSWSACCRCGRR